jgi:hypothetical protein
MATPTPFIAPPILLSCHNNIPAVGAQDLAPLQYIRTTNQKPNRNKNTQT